MESAFENPLLDQTATELKRQIEAERDDRPFLVYRAAGGDQRIVVLAADRRLTIGRDPGNDLTIDDEQVSRVHAELAPIGNAWVIDDQGLSTNGTFVNGERLTDRARLTDRDLIGIGGTGILFRQPGAGRRAGPTVASAETGAVQSLTDTQQRILVALCRPFATGDPFASPATNRQIAAEMHLSIDAVKGHLRVLFDRFGLAELAQNEKRARLAEKAIRSGLVKPRDLG